MKLTSYLRLMLMFLCVANISFSKVLADESFQEAQSQEHKDVIVADFEADNYGSWQVTGTAFGTGPAQGTLPGQKTVSGFEGSGLVNSYNGGDTSTGKLTSPEFKINRPCLNFLIGGGGFAGQTCMNLLVDGVVVRTATGRNTGSGGSERLDWMSWDVKDLIGEDAIIEIVDQHTGGWGHISVDSISQSLTARQTYFDKQKTVSVSKKYLNIPVKNGIAKRLCRVFVDQKIVREFTVGLAGSEPDFWVYLDISEFTGKDAIIQIDCYTPENAAGFDSIFQDDTYPGAENTYKEALRPQIHFSSKRGWINDTNGMVYYDGEYHMFYQHNPYGCGWGNMTWGHAVSADMLHWNELGDAIHPDELGTIFSGGAVVDWNNTAGFQTGSEKTIVAFYTYAGGDNQLSKGKLFTQAIAYSNDRGRTWTKYANNPVIDNIVNGNRDPKVIWYEPTQKWVMVLYLSNGIMGIFNSTDLKSWTKTSEFKCFNECPELFELAVDGDQTNKKWVLYGGKGDYYLGSFDGQTFVPQSDVIHFNHGNCFYASQTFSDIPASDGRRIQMAWAKIDMPGMPFNQMILFPVSLSLRTTPAGVRLCPEPVAEIESLYQQSWAWQNETVAPGSDLTSAVNGECLRIQAVLQPKGASSFSFIIGNVPVTYDFAAAQLSCSGQSATVSLSNDKVKLDIIVDRMSLEIFADDGQVYMPVKANLTAVPDTLKLDSVGGNTQVVELTVNRLSSVWNKN